MTPDAQLSVIVGALLAADVAAAGLATGLRLPAPVLLAVLGHGGRQRRSGPDRVRRLPRSTRDRRPALVPILFERGVAAGWQLMRPVLLLVASVAVVGTVVTAAIAGLSAGALLEFSLFDGLLPGVILAATDRAAVFAVMREVGCAGGSKESPDSTTRSLGCWCGC